jgi:hypothetical protein
LQIADYCREIETYLCRKNDGHLIRVVGPSFDIVSRWAEQGVPLKVAYKGIDRYFERYYRKGPRRRPVKIDFCEADVLDVFDEWRRATGVVNVAGGSQSSGDGSAACIPGSSRDERLALQKHHLSLPAHLERVLLRLTSARASGALGAPFDALVDRVSAELDAARGKAGGLRGEARLALIRRLSALDTELMQQAREALDDAARASFAREADEDLSGFRAGMTAEAFARARDSAIDRLVRERYGLPTITFE